MKYKILKEIGFNILVLIYIFASLMILGFAILFPFGIGMKDFPTWVGWIIYPLALIICASQRMVLRYFEQKNVL